MEEFDAAWGEVEKGLRDSFRAGREKKRGQRLENTASNAQRQMEMIRQRQSQAPKAATGKRTAPRRTVSSPPTPTPTPTPTRPAPPSGGPKRETVSAPPAPEPKTERQMWGRPEGAEAIDVEASMGELTPNPQPAGSGEIAEGQTLDDFFSAGRQPKQEASKLEPVIAAKVQPKTPNQDLGDRKGKVPFGYNAEKRRLQQSIWDDDITEDEATEQFLDWGKAKRGEHAKPLSLEESKAKLSGGEQAIPVPQTGSPYQQPMQQITADPIDNTIGDVAEAIDLSDGVNDPSNDEAKRAGWDAVEQEIAPPPAPPVSEIPNPASQVPDISTPVNDGYNQALNQQFSEANRDVRNLRDEFGAEPGEPEPPAPVADTPVEVETEQPTSVADTPVEDQNPTAGLPKANPEAGKTAANIKPSKDVAQAASKNIASEGVSYGDYSEHMKAAMQGNKASLDFLRNNPDAVTQFSPTGLPDRIKNSMGGEAPAKAKSKPKPKSKKTTAKTVASGKQPTNPKKKSEPVKTDGDFGTFAGEKPVIKALDWHDLGFLRPYSEDTTFYTDRKGRPAIASAQDPSHVSVAHARPSNMSVEQLNRIIEGTHPLSYTNSRLFNTAGKPIMMNLPSAGSSSWVKEENKDPRNNWVVDGKNQLPNMKKPASDDNFAGAVDLKTLLANNPSLKVSNRQPFGRPSTKNYGIGLPVHFEGIKGPSIGHTLDYGSGRGVYEAQLNSGRLVGGATRGKTPGMTKLPLQFKVPREPVEMSIRELMQRLKTATSKDAEENVNMNESAYSKDQLKYLHRGLNTQSDKDETVSIYAGNDYPLEARLLGGEYENDAGEHIRNLLTQFIAPRIPGGIEGQNNILE